jgi:hypothetical protein
MNFRIQIYRIVFKFLVRYGYRESKKKNKTSMWLRNRTKDHHHSTVLMKMVKYHKICQVFNNCHLMVCVAEMTVHGDRSARVAQIGKRGYCACAAEAPAHPQHSHSHLWKIYSTIKKKLYHPTHQLFSCWLYLTIKKYRYRTGTIQLINCYLVGYI